MRRFLLAGVALALFTTGTLAQEPWKPTKPIKIVVPFAPGGGADTSARLVSKGLSERLGQPVIVENKPGASGAIGSDFVYGATPDGTVLLAATSDAQAVNPHLHKTKSETMKFVPLAGITSSSFVLMGRKDLAAADLRELLELTKTKSLSYASAGSGTAIHVVTAAFASVAKIGNMLHVPFQGGGPAIQAVLAGDVDLMMVPGSIAGAYLARLKVYGSTGTKRNEFMAAVPTLTEQGMALVADSWTGLVAPPDTPPLIASALAKAVFETVNEPAMQKLFKDQSRESFRLDQVQFAKYYNEEFVTWGRLIKSANVKTD
ncbi:MAG: tripartite tricarboxylate transporter substrate binding protein [Variovorax sp.]